MTDIIIKSGDTPSGLAKSFVGNASKWPDFCKANPQFKAHQTYGCVFYAGNVAHLPSTWPAVPGGPLPAPIPGPVPQPVGPAITTPNSVVPAEAAPEASASLIGGLSQKTVIIGGVAIAGLIVAVYAAKRKKPAGAHA